MAAFKVGSNGAVAVATADSPAVTVLGAPATKLAAPAAPATVAAPALPQSLAANPSVAAFWAAASKLPTIDTTTRKQGRYLGWLDKDDAEVQAAIKGIQKGTPYLYVEGEIIALPSNFSFMMLDPVDHYIRVTPSFAFEYAAVAPTGESAFQARINNDPNLAQNKKAAYRHRYINAKLIVFTGDSLVPVTVTAQFTKLDAFRELAAEQVRTTTPEWSKGDSVKAGIVGALPVGFRVLGGMTMVTNAGTENVSYIAKPNNIRAIGEAESKLLAAWLEAGAPGMTETEEAYNYRLAAIEKVLLK